MYMHTYKSVIIQVSLAIEQDIYEKKYYVLYHAAILCSKMCAKLLATYLDI